MKNRFKKMTGIFSAAASAAVIGIGTVAAALPVMAETTQVEVVAAAKKTNIVNRNGVWTYTVNSKPDYSYTGFAQNVNGWWYVERGKVTFKKNDVIQGTVNGKNGWWNVKGSKVIFNETIEQNRNGWWYIKNGKVDFTKTSVEHNANGWWYVKNGKVDFNYTGFASNYNGWWYIENGKVTFKRNDVILGRVKGDSGWWNVKGSKVIFNTTIANNKNGWWYIEDGEVEFDYNGFAKNENGWWYVENGKVTFTKNGNIKGRVDGKYSTWIVKGSKVVGEANSTSSSTSGDLIGTAKAKSIALSHAGLKESQVWGIDVELDWERGVRVYDVDFETRGYDYNYDIDAYTGKIIKYEKERD